MQQRALVYIARQPLFNRNNVKEKYGTVERRRERVFVVVFGRLVICRCVERNYDFVEPYLLFVDEPSAMLLLHLLSLERVDANTIV